MVDPTQSLAFPMNVVALLPYMLLNYEDANELCIRSAENIAQVSSSALLGPVSRARQSTFLPGDGNRLHYPKCCVLFVVRL